MAKGFTHIGKPSGVEGIYVGKKGAEIQAFGADGNIYQKGTKIDATGAEINRVADVSGRIISATANLTVAEATHEGKIVVLNKAAGLAVTLPDASGSGAIYRFVVGTALTSGAYSVKVTGATNVMVGSAIISDDAGTDVFFTAATSDTITLNGSTTGGLVGSYIECIDALDNKWVVKVVAGGSSAGATPFSAAVS